MHDEKPSQILKEIYVEVKENEDSNRELISALLTEFFIKAERKYGFDSISGFYDAFRKITGTTPNKFTHTV